MRDGTEVSSYITIDITQRPMLDFLQQYMICIIYILLARRPLYNFSLYKIRVGTRTENLAAIG